MSVGEAIRTLRQPLVFGNPKQIEAARFLERHPGLRLTMQDFLPEYPLRPEYALADEDEWPDEDDGEDELE